MLNKLYQDVFVDPFSFDSHLLKELVKTSLNVNGETKNRKDVKDRDSKLTNYVVRSENEFLGACHTIKNVQKKSFTEVVHFILSQSIKYF